MLRRHWPIWSARTSDSSPLVVASNAAASMPSRMSARLAGESFIHSHHLRSRSAWDSSGVVRQPPFADLDLLLGGPAERGVEDLLARPEVVHECGGAAPERPGERPEREVRRVPWRRGRSTTPSSSRALVSRSGGRAMGVGLSTMPSRARLRRRRSAGSLEHAQFLDRDVAAHRMPGRRPRRAAVR